MTGLAPFFVGRKFYFEKKAILDFSNASIEGWLLVLSDAVSGFEIVEEFFMAAVASPAGRASIRDGCEFRMVIFGPPDSK
jgi:hypothetical protein